MKLYAITQTGKQALATGGGSNEERQILNYLADGPATADQLLADHITMKLMVKHGLVKELTE